LVPASQAHGWNVSWAVLQPQEPTVAGAAAAAAAQAEQPPVCVIGPLTTTTPPVGAPAGVPSRTL